MKRCIWLLIALSLVLGGCSWMDGNFHSVTVHEAHTQSGGSDEVSAGDYYELVAALESMISAGREKGIIYVGEYDLNMVESGMLAAVSNVVRTMPLAAYAVDNITYDLGSTGGKPAIALDISYLHSRLEILQIRTVDTMDSAEVLIEEALAAYSTGIVLLVEEYTPRDITQLVQDYAEEHPQLIMEVPQVASGLYPEEGTSRILELKFSYQNSRESLREMKEHVTSMFNAADLYVSSDDTDEQKILHLYSFLMERFDYQVETSITPTYSLLRHGVGDSKAFAVVYAAMCRQAGLECHTVTGTRNGEPWYWNIVRNGELYSHVDLLCCREQGAFHSHSDGEMTGYVWDYSAYPVCPEPVPEEDDGNTDGPGGSTESTQPSTEAPTEEPTQEPTEEPTQEPTQPEETEPEETTAPTDPTDSTESTTEAPTTQPQQQGDSADLTETP